jgi:membrane-associated protein
MADALLHFAEELMSSWWIYVTVWGFAALAAISWGLYCSLVGYIGGKAFEDNPLKGVVLGIGLALGVTLIVELVRHHLRKRRPQPQVDPHPDLVEATDR